MSDVVEMEKSSLINLVKLLETVHHEASLTSWDVECVEYLEKLGYQVAQLKLLLKHYGE